MKPSISIVIPAYNEEQRLPSTLNRIREYFAGAPWELTEVLVVDDGSRDGTAALVERIAAADPVFRLVRNPGNRGKGYSVRNGMTQTRGQWSLFTDADLSAPIEELEKLYEAAAKQRRDVVMGSRALDRSLIQVHQSSFRENGGRVFNLFVQSVAGLPYWDTQCGFKLFSTEAAHQVFRRVRTDGFGFDAEALFIARKLGYRIAEIPVRWSHVEGTKLGLFSDSFEMILDLFRIRWNHLLGRYR